MADVRIVCVREDVALAETLADLFDAAGFSVDDDPSDAPLDDVGAVVLLWSEEAIGSPAFRNSAQRAIDAGKAVVANRTDASPYPIVGSAPVFDLSVWDGVSDDPALDALSEAVEGLVTAPAAAEPVYAPAFEPVVEEPEPEVEEVPPQTFEIELPRRAGLRLSFSWRVIASALMLFLVFGAAVAGIGHFGLHLNRIAAVQPPAEVVSPIAVTTLVEAGIDQPETASLADIPTPPTPSLVIPTPPAPPAHAAAPVRRTRRASSVPPPVTSWDRNQPIATTRPHGPPS